MTTTAPPVVDHLAVACAHQATIRLSEVGLAVAVVEHMLSRPPLDDADVAAHAVPARLKDEDAEIAALDASLNRPGVPAVSAIAVAELGAALDLSTAGARKLVSELFELAFRLPGVWAQVRAGEVAVWVARRIAAQTLALNAAAAGVVDRQLRDVVGRVGMRQVERLVAAATAQEDPDLHLAREETRAERRCFHVDLDRTTPLGHVPVGGMLELPDALALDAAVRHAAAELGSLGSTDTLDARRARAVGDVAREHLVLWDGDGPEPQPDVARPAEGRRLDPHENGWPLTEGIPADSPASVERTRRARRAPSRRHLVLHVHLSDRALTAGGEREPSTALMGRMEDPHLPVTADTIRRWCGDVHTRLTVLPVLDLEQEKHHGAYEIPARMREHVVARDVTCVFPRCATPARACDLDHVVPFDHAAHAGGPGQRGPTATDNLAPLCRRHHRLKTTGRIGYRVLGPGAYEWTFPDGTRALVDRTGTRSLGTPGAGIRRARLSVPGRPEPSAPDFGADPGRRAAGTSAPSQHGTLPTSSASRAASLAGTVLTRPRRRPARIRLPLPDDDGEPPF